MSKYDELDRHIVKAIARGMDTFTVISRSGAVVTESHRLGELTGAADWRIVDRRLQALRKAGRIAYAKRAWSVTETA